MKYQKYEARVRLKNGNEGGVRILFSPRVMFPERARERCLMAVQEVLEQEGILLKPAKTKAEIEKEQLIALLEDAATAICLDKTGHANAELTQTAIIAKWKPSERKQIGISTKRNLIRKLKKHGINWEEFKSQYTEREFPQVTMQSGDETVSGTLIEIDWKNVLRRRKRKSKTIGDRNGSRKR